MLEKIQIEYKDNLNGTVTLCKEDFDNLIQDSKKYKPIERIRNNEHDFYEKREDGWHEIIISIDGKQYEVLKKRGYYSLLVDKNKKDEYIVIQYPQRYTEGYKWKKENSFLSLDDAEKYLNM